ncbi:MAG: hypothetical protein ACUVXD_17550 [Thermodesulfobacteriota bacterium]
MAKDLVMNDAVHFYRSDSLLLHTTSCLFFVLPLAFVALVWLLSFQIEPSSNWETDRLMLHGFVFFLVLAVWVFIDRLGIGALSSRWSLLLVGALIDFLGAFRRASGFLRLLLGGLAFVVRGFGRGYDTLHADLAKLTGG